MNLTAHAPAIHCEGCAQSIKNSLGKLSGVQSVAVDVEQKNVTITFDAALTSPDKILVRLDAAGFSANILE